MIGHGYRPAPHRTTRVVPSVPSARTVPPRTAPRCTACLLIDPRRSIRMTHPCTTHPGYKQNTSTEYLYKPTSTATLTIPPPPKKTKSGERQIRDFLRTRFPGGCTAWNKIDGGFYVAAQLHLGSGMSRVRVLQKGLRLFPKQWPRVRRLGTADRLGTQFGAGEPGYC